MKTNDSELSRHIADPGPPGIDFEHVSRLLAEATCEDEEYHLYETCLMFDSDTVTLWQGQHLGRMPDVGLKETKSLNRTAIRFRNGLCSG